MVAETHSHHDRIDPDDILTLLAGHLDTGDPAFTLADRGFRDDADLFDLLAEEYSEPGLTSIDPDELGPDTTLTEPIAMLTGPGQP